MSVPARCDSVLFPPRQRVVLDVDQDNYIDATELRAVMEGLGETLTDAEYIELLKEVDMDANGSVPLRVGGDVAAMY